MLSILTPTIDLAKLFELTFGSADSLPVPPHVIIFGSYHGIVKGAQMMRR